MNTITALLDYMRVLWNLPEILPLWGIFAASCAIALFYRLTVGRYRT